MQNVTLETLIAEQKERIPTLQYHQPPRGFISSGTYSYPEKSNYLKWLTTTRRYINIHFPMDKDVEAFESKSQEKITPKQQRELLAILEAFEIFPSIITPISNNQDSNQTLINITNKNINSNEQYQNQELVIYQQFVNAISDELTGKQINELKQIVAEADNDLKQAHPRLIEALKSFGVNVGASIVANFLTNPSIWSLF